MFRASISFAKPNLPAIRADLRDKSVRLSQRIARRSEYYIKTTVSLSKKSILYMGNYADQRDKK